MHTINVENNNTQPAPLPDGAAKWRRRGGERRGTAPKNTDFTEKRSSGDRRRHLLVRVSKVIFPRGKDGYGY